MATKAKRREVYGPISRVRLRERRQSNGIIRALHLRLSGAREEIAQLKRDNAGLVEVCDKRVADLTAWVTRKMTEKDEELAKVKREYDALAHEWARDKAERVSLERVVVEQAKRIYNWPSVKKEGG